MWLETGTRRRRCENNVVQGKVKDDENDYVANLVLDVGCCGSGCLVVVVVVKESCLDALFLFTAHSFANFILVILAGFNTIFMP